MIWDNHSALECHCGGILQQWGNDLLCEACGRRYCAECGGEVVIEGHCGYCVACAASSCEA